MWELTALNFIVFINSGYRAYNCFQMAKQLTKENDFRKRLQAISKNFNEHQISKTFTDEPENNYEMVKKAIEDIENDFNDLQQLLTEIKENLDNHINQKKAFIGNIFLEIIKIGYAGYIAFLFSGISFVLGVGNIIFGVGNIVSNGIGLKYTNDLIDANIEILKDAKKQLKAIEIELNKLYNKLYEIQKTYPNYKNEPNKTLVVLNEQEYYI